MPIISRFFGILIYIYWKEHAPPHFHARYGDYEASFEIETGKMSGNMSSRAIGLIQEWRIKHERELMADWQLASLNRPVNRIEGLE